MSANRKDKTPILHRLKSQETDQPGCQSPNIYTKQFQRQRTIKQSSSRGTLARSKYKKAAQKKSSNSNHEENQKISLLLKQNSELRKQIVQLKVHQFYQFDDKKLKQLLIQVQSLKKELKKYKENLEQSEIQNDFLRRTNSELRAELQKFQETKVYEKKYKQNTHKTLALTPRGLRQDEQLTERIVQKPVISSSKPYDDFQDCRKLLESKSTTKKDRVKRAAKQTQNEYLLMLQSKQRMMEPISPRNSYKPRLSTSPRQSNDLLLYKSKRSPYLNRDQM